MSRGSDSLRLRKETWRATGWSRISLPPTKGMRFKPGQTTKASLKNTQPEVHRFFHISCNECRDRQQNQAQENLCSEDKENGAEDLRTSQSGSSRAESSLGR